MLEGQVAGHAEPEGAQNRSDGARPPRSVPSGPKSRGVDVGAKAEIYQLLDEVACQGVAVLMISSELPELLNLARRIVVLRDGSVAEYGTLSELLRRNGIFAGYYRTQFPREPGSSPPVRSFA